MKLLFSSTDKNMEHVLYSYVYVLVRSINKARESLKETTGWDMYNGISFHTVLTGRDCTDMTRRAWFFERYIVYKRHHILKYENWRNAALCWFFMWLVRCWSAPLRQAWLAAPDGGCFHYSETGVSGPLAAEGAWVGCYPLGSVPCAVTMMLVTVAGWRIETKTKLNHALDLHSSSSHCLSHRYPTPSGSRGTAPCVRSWVREDSRHALHSSRRSWRPRGGVWACCAARRAATSGIGASPPWCGALAPPDAAWFPW